MLRLAGNLRSSLLALVLAVGTALVWIVVAVVVGNIVAARQQAEQLREMRYQQLVVLQDGTPVIATTSYADVATRTFQNLDGTPSAGGSELRSANLLPASMLDRYARRPDWITRVQGCSDLRQPPSFWYFVHDGQRRGRAWFEGYDSVTGRRIGWIGRQGFRPQELAKDELFAVDERALSTGSALLGHVSPGSMPWAAPASVSSTAWGAARSQIPAHTVYLVAAGELLEIDLAARKIRTVLGDAGIVSAGVVEQALEGVGPAANSGPPDQYLAARSAQALWIVDPSRNTSRRFPLPAELDSRYLGVYLLQDGLLLRVDTGSLDVIWLDDQANVTRRQSVVLERPGSQPISSWLSQLGAAVMLPVPALFGVLVLVVAPWEAVVLRETGSYAQAVATALQDFGWPALGVTLLAAALAVWCFRRHRRLGQSGGWLWFVFVLLLGLPGLAGYLLHRRWPVRLACPNCAQLAPRDRFACHLCGAEFPRPPVTGTEVLEG